MGRPDFLKAFHHGGPEGLNGNILTGVLLQQIVDQITGTSDLLAKNVGILCESLAEALQDFDTSLEADKLVSLVDLKSALDHLEGEGGEAMSVDAVFEGCIGREHTLNEHLESGNAESFRTRVNLINAKAH